MPAPIYRHSKLIGEKVREGVAQGVPISKIIASVAHYQDCPHNATTFSRVYAKDIAEAEFELAMSLGKYAMKRIEEGSDPILLHALKAKAGWIAEEKVAVRESDGNEDTSVIDDILSKLGKNTKTEDVSNDPTQN